MSIIACGWTKKMELLKMVEQRGNLSSKLLARWETKHWQMPLKKSGISRCSLDILSLLLYAVMLTFDF